jgi:LCP family protein required for cell wall assembly
MMDPKPKRPHIFSSLLRRDWLNYGRILIPIVVVGILGFGLGAYLYLLSQTGAFTGGRVVQRPDDSSFSLPLRLTRRVNVLLIGTDITIGEKKQVLPVARADTLLLVSFDPDRDRIAALSIPRDTKAEIPRVGTRKINSAYAYGGPNLTIKAVEHLLGVKIDYYVKLGPKSFARFIDAIGGVEVDVEKDMKYTDTWADLYIDLKKGHQLLTGAQAEGYIRFRADEHGDIGRVERQQKVLMALFSKMNNPAMILRAPQLVRAFTENTQMNLTLTEVMTLGMFGARLQTKDIATGTLPGTVTEGGLYWEPDWPKVRGTVLDLFYGVSPQVLATTRIEILNASGVPGVARRTAERLELLGFKVVRVATTSPVRPQTVIIDRTGRAEVTRFLAEVLGQPRVRRDIPVADIVITVVLARDYSARR